MLTRSDLLAAAVATALFPATVEAMQQASPASMVWDFEERCALILRGQPGNVLLAFGLR